MATFLLLIVGTAIVYAVVVAIRSSEDRPGTAAAPRTSSGGARPSDPAQAESQRRAGAIADAVREGEAAWVPPGRTTTIAGYDIPGGMLYVSRHLRSLRDWGAVDPALVNPGLRVSRDRPDRAGQFMRYWPSPQRFSLPCPTPL
jgi:hypothetical protein